MLLLGSQEKICMNSRQKGQHTRASWTSHEALDGENPSKMFVKKKHSSISYSYKYLLVQRGVFF